MRIHNNKVIQTHISRNLSHLGSPGVVLYLVMKGTIRDTLDLWLKIAQKQRED